jgi:hypothetical protein
MEIAFLRRVVSVGSFGLALSLGLRCRVAFAAGSRSSSTIYFAHNDSTYLRPGQQAGGAALVPEQVEPDALPLVVFLHGTNPKGDLHLWLGGGGRDLRPAAERLYRSPKLQPFVLAGPSQTRAASHGTSLWQSFDLSAFVEDVARALDGKATIDRSAVVFFGHSGAGCNPLGGLASDFWSKGSVLPRALLAVDPCLDAQMGAAFARRPAVVPIWVMWQSSMWPRQPTAFRKALQQGRPEGRVDQLEELRVGGTNAHDTILPVALERAARELFVRPAQTSGAS